MNKVLWQSAAAILLFLYENVLYSTLTMRMMPICGMLSDNITHKSKKYHSYMDGQNGPSTLLLGSCLKDKVYRAK